MADPEDYESLPDSAPFVVTATAGALAGICEHCVMFPVDSVKTRMQSLSCEKQHRMGISRMLISMMREEGVFRPIRGMNAMAAGAGPAHAMYFTCLEMGKTVTNGVVPAHISDGMSAVVATVLHDGVMTPAEVVKQRMQMCCSPYLSCLNCTWSVFRQEGLKAFYRAYPTTLAMNIPFQASMVMTYGSAQRFLNPKKEYNPYVHFMCGAVAGGVASAVTMPLDVCKTLLNTQEKGVLKLINRAEITGLFPAASVVYKVAGFQGFFNGLSARILYQAPSTAIAWSVYEFFKYYFSLGRGYSTSDTSYYDTLSSKATPLPAP